MILSVNLQMKKQSSRHENAAHRMICAPLTALCTLVDTSLTDHKSFLADAPVPAIRAQTDRLRNVPIGDRSVLASKAARRYLGRPTTTQA